MDRQTLIARLHCIWCSAVKMWPLWCIATWGRLTSHQFFSTWIMMTIYFDFNTWPYDLVSRVLLCCGLTQSTYPVMKWYFRLIRYVMLWPWPLTPWPWTCVVDLLSCDQTTYQIWARSINPQLSYWQFSHFLKGRTFKLYSSEGVDQTAPNFERTELHLYQSVPLHQCETLVPICCFCFERWLLNDEWCQDRGQISLFLTPVKIGEGQRRLLSGRNEYTLCLVYIWWTAAARCRSIGVW